MPEKKIEMTALPLRTGKATFWTKNASLLLSVRKTLLVIVKWLCVALLLLLCLSLAACAHSPAPPFMLPRAPMQPALSEPLPLVPYSTSAAQRIKSWGQQLIGTFPTSKP